MPAEIFVGLGSNIDPERNLKGALAALRQSFGAIDLSPVYRNRAIGFVGDDFLNLVVRFRSDADPRALEKTLRDMELAAGRVRGAAASTGERAPATGSRTLDLDLLLYGAMVDPELRLPRDDIRRYPFVLRPLAELAPDLVHPVTGRAMSAEWEELAHHTAPMLAVVMSDGSHSAEPGAGPRVESGT